MLVVSEAMVVDALERSAKCPPLALLRSLMICCSVGTTGYCNIILFTGDYEV